LKVLADFHGPVSSDSEARWARGQAKTLVVFVHGFGGQAVSTWGDFADLAMEHSAYAQSDLVFLGYESRARPATFSRNVLYWALKALVEQTNLLLNRAGLPSRQSDFAYERIILVGHSLGGALVRDVAMKAKAENEAWADKIGLALFAPAHLGAQIIGLAQASVGFLRFGPIESLLIRLYPVLADLKPDSPYLQALLERAKTIGAGHGTTQALFVAHADDDWVVNRDDFYSDRPYYPYLGTDHVRCCKPCRAPRFDQPVEDLARQVL
jgi:pimeloyl-ACP methyl ester carboxylesterase